MRYFIYFIQLVILAGTFVAGKIALNLELWQAICLFSAIAICIVAYIFLNYRFMRKLRYTYNRSSIARSFLSVLSDADEIVIVDENLRIVYAKTLRSASRTEPFDFETWLGSLFTASKQTLKECQQALGNGTYFEDVFSTQKINEYGPENYILVRVLPLYNGPGGIPPYRALVFSDITLYYVQAQKQQEQTPPLLEKYFEAAPFGFIYVNGQGKILGVNNTLKKWLGAAQYKLGVSLTSITDVAPNRIDAILHAKSPVEIKIKPNRIDQTPALVFSTQLTENYYILAIYRQNQTFIRHAQKHPINQLPVPSLLVEQSGEIAAINKAFPSLFSAQYLHMYPMGTGSMIKDYLVPEAQSAIENVLRTLEPAQSIVLPDINFITDGPSVMAYIEHVGEKQFLFQMIDTSSQKKLEQQFVQAQKTQAVGQLAGGIAHDFNNLLTAMIGFCDLLLQRVMPNDPSYTDIMHIKQNANRASNLVRQLLAFSRRQTLLPRKINVTDTLSDISALLRRLIGSQINFKVSHYRNLWPIKVDVSQFEQVIINIVVNARDAMPHGGDLTIETSNYTNPSTLPIGNDVLAPGDYILIKIIDSGCGIPADILNSIFEPFFSTKEVGAGTGLGLATAYGIIKQTGGAIGVESIEKKGTTFKIFLPRCKDKDAATPTVQESAVSDITGNETIFLVEDEDAVRLFASKALRDKGYRVMEAQNGEEALALLEKGPIPDVLITDVVMPKMDGPTLSKKVREQYPDIHIIFTSGYAEETFRQDLTQNASIHFLPKPFTLRELATKVREVLHNKMTKEQAPPMAVNG